jgi:hypothetical protein
LTIESSNLGPGGTFFVRGAPKSKNKKIFFLNKTYHVDTSRKGKIERNTIKILSDRFELTKKKVIEKMRKKHSNFLGFLNF